MEPLASTSRAAIFDKHRYRTKEFLNRPKALRHQSRSGRTLAPHLAEARHLTWQIATGARSRCQLQKTIVKLLGNQGDPVELGQTICVLEAMRMNTPMRANHRRRGRKLHASIGASHDFGDVAAVVE